VLLCLFHCERLLHQVNWSDEILPSCASCLDSEGWGVDHSCNRMGSGYPEYLLPSPVFLRSSFFGVEVMLQSSRLSGQHSSQNGAKTANSGNSCIPAGHLSRRCIRSKMQRQLEANQRGGLVDLCIFVPSYCLEIEFVRE
jgi:hypothetical protein